MANLAAVRNQVVLVVSGLAKALLVDVWTAEKKVSVTSMEPRTEEELGAVVDRLCLEAVDKILKIIEAGVTRQEVTAGEAPSPSDGACGSTVRTGEEAVPVPSRDHAHILLLTVSQPIRLQRDEPWRRCFQSLLVAPQSANRAEGEETPPRPLPSSPPPADDHEYARPSASARRGPVQTHLPCSQCTKLFPSAERLADHRSKSHPLCSVCSASFSGVLKLRQHEIREHGLLPYSCSYCPKRFNHKTHRDLHEKARHTREKSCHCDICGRGYSCISVLKTHRLTHFNKTFICEVCGKAFYHASHLKRHTLVHQEVRPYSCSTCGRGFTQAANLRSHQATHTRERQLCSVCGKSFRCLKNHLISKHSHEVAASELPPPHTIIGCQVCGKKFPNASQCRAHQRSHTGEKPFHCTACGKSFRLKEQLQVHVSTHGGQKPYRCSLCSKSFRLASSFLRHRGVHSAAKPYGCRDCGKSFRLRAFLKAHLQTTAHLRRTQHNQNPTAAQGSDPH